MFLKCPNPTCPRQFQNPDQVTDHLSRAGSGCAAWNDNFFANLFARSKNHTTDAEEVIEWMDSDEDDLPPLASTEPLADLPSPSSPLAPASGTAASIPSRAPSMYKLYHTNQSRGLAGGRNTLQAIAEDDKESEKHRESNLYYPFHTRDEWQIANWMTSSGLSQSQINSFLHLDAIRNSRLTFSSVGDIRARIESLPSPSLAESEDPSSKWQHQTIVLNGYRTKDPMVLYWRDGLAVVKQLFANPIFADCLEMTPYRLLETGTDDRAYGEYMSGNYAWDYQSTIGPGHTQLGIIMASDKTPLTIGTGNKEMHPVLMSLANIDAGVRMKATSHAFSLVAYLPIPKFEAVTAEVHAVLVARVYHICNDTITANLKIAEAGGKMLSDPRGYLRMVHTPLVSYISDRPEQLTIAGVLSNMSPTSLATQESFGDAEASPRRHREDTLVKIAQACSATDPKDVPAFAKTCRTLGLSGVHQPFWRDWGNANPSQFLTPDALHQWHKFFFDHILKWVVTLVGKEEFDARLKALQIRVGTRHWHHGVTTLKQLTGREHRDLEKIIIPVAAGAVHDQVLMSVRGMVEFIFGGQGRILFEEHLHSVGEGLREFHAFKSRIILEGGRRGKNGPIPHFRIPKLEAMHGVVNSARLMGAPYQYTSDITERCHITHVKKPWRSTNHRMPHIQCLAYLDRLDKCRLFSLYTSLREYGADLLNPMVTEATEMANHYPEATWLAQILPPDDMSYPKVRSTSSLFNKQHRRLSDDSSTAFIVAKRPHLPSMSIAGATAQFQLVDLRGALGDYFGLQQTYAQRGGQRKSIPDCSLPFEALHVWNSFRMQQTSTQDSSILIPPQTVQALPPSATMPFGRCNTVLVEDRGSGEHFQSGESEGIDLKVVQVRLLFSPIYPGDSPQSVRSAEQPIIYFYGESFKFSPHHKDIVNGATIYKPAPVVDMFLLNRHFRGNGTRMGDIYPLTSVREVVDLVPQFGKTMDRHLNCNNSLELPTNFYLNHFSDKETFHAILSYQ